jgi:hypothetical protein
MLLHMLHHLLHHPSNFFLEFCDLSFAITTSDVQAVLDEQSDHQTSMANFKTQKTVTSPLSSKGRKKTVDFHQINWFT